MGGNHASPSHIGLMLDCAEICGTSARFMQRKSERHALTCGVCAQICEACARECESMANGDDVMLRCAALCHECAASCREMSMARA
jgi:hypothetical protein